MPDMISIRAKGVPAVKFAAVRPAGTRQQMPRPAAVAPQLQQQPVPATTPQQRKAAASKQPGTAGAQQQQQQYQVQLASAAGPVQGLGTSAVRARGTADHLPVMMAPAAAAKGAAAVFGGLNGELPAAGNIWGVAQVPPAAAGAASGVVPQQPVQQFTPQHALQQQNPVPAQQQQQQQAPAGFQYPAGTYLQQQPAAPAQAALQQQPQQPVQVLQHQQQQQHKQDAAAVAAALAAERARHAVEQQAAKAEMEKKDAEIKRLRKSDVELRLLKQVWLLIKAHHQNISHTFRMCTIIVPLVRRCTCLCCCCT